jgi:hypothetical protein
VLFSTVQNRHKGTHAHPAVIPDSSSIPMDELERRMVNCDLYSNFIGLGEGLKTVSLTKFNNLAIIGLLNRLLLFTGYFHSLIYCK